MAPKTWDPLQIVLTFKGYEISGYADGTFLTAARTEETFTLNVGAQGHVTRVMSRNRSGTIVITLQMSSMSNGILSQIMEDDERNGTGTGDVQLKDLAGNTLIHGDEAWVMKPADAGHAKDLESREWTIQVASLEMHLDGIGS